MLNKYMATIFSGNAYSYNRSLHQFKQTNSNAGTQERVDLNKFQILYKKALLTLQTDITNFGTGNLDQLNNFDYTGYLTSLDVAYDGANYNTPEIQKLTAYSYDSTTFNKYRNILVNVVRGLENAIKINKNDTALKNTIAAQAATINALSTKPINTYIGTTGLTNIYTTANVDIQATELLPWFAEYLFLYGPPSGAFDANLLAIIVDTQIKKGLYTMEYFLDTKPYIL